MANLRLIIIGMMFLPLLGSAQWFTYLTDAGSDRAEGLYEFPDGTFAITGTSSSFYTGDAQAFLVRGNHLGIKQWSKAYGGSGFELGRRVMYIPDTCYYIAGYTTSIGNGGFDFYLVKTDTSGNLIWEKAYGEAGWERVHDASLTKDSGVVMVGETSSNPNDDIDIYIVRTKSNGDTLWTKQIGQQGTDIAYDVLKVNDTTFIASGGYFHQDSLMTKPWAMKFYDDGTVVWEKVFDEIGEAWINQLSVDGISTDFRGVGGAKRLVSNGIDDFTCVFDNQGNGYAGFVYEQQGNHEHLGIVKMQDGTNEFFVITKTEDQYTAQGGGNDITLNRFTSNFIWMEGNVIAHFGEEMANEIITTSDNHVALVGYTRGIQQGVNDAYIMETGNNGAFPDIAVVHNLSDIAGIEEEILLKSIRVYPNPFSASFVIEDKDAVFEQVSVMSLSGEVLKTISLNWKEEINLSNLSSGCYILVFSGEKGRAIMRLMKH